MVSPEVTPGGSDKHRPTRCVGLELLALGDAIWDRHGERAHFLVGRRRRLRCLPRENTKITILEYRLS